MIDREQGISRPIERTGTQDDHDCEIEGSAVPLVLNDDEVEAVRRLRFLAVLDKIMTDHHDVLAALAQ